MADRPKPQAFADFLEKESNTRWAKDNATKELPVEKALAEGVAIGPLSLKEVNHKSCVWRLNGTYSRFRKGDKVALVPLERNSLKASKNDLKIEIRGLSYPEAGVIEISSQVKRSIPDENQKFIAVADDDFGWADEKIQSKIIEMGSPSVVAINCTKKPHELKFTAPEIEKLNKVQKEAFQTVVDGKLNGCVQGPPGTGKSHLIRAMVQYCLEMGLKVGMTAFTHSAIDKFCSSLGRIQSTGKLCRIGNPLKIDTPLYDRGSPIRFVKSIGEVPFDTQFAAATTHAWALSNTASFKPDVLFVDEAGQVPSFFLPILEFVCSNIIAVGDHKQLPPIILSDEKKIGMKTDLFSFLLNEKKWVMLETQYRMNRELQNWSSERYYESKLQPYESITSRDITGGINLKGYGQKKVTAVVHGEQCSGGASPGEASLIADLVSAILRDVSSIKMSDIGIITPHRMHAGAVNAALQKTFGPSQSTGILVDTVERFQGQEREVIILGFGSDGTFSGSENGQELEFLSNPKRLNVAVTRAKSRLFSFVSDKLREKAEKAQDRELHEFFKWMGRVS